MKRVFADWTWGFTGSRTGWTDPQRAAVEELWDMVPPARLYHGDCIGSDFNAHRLALTNEPWYTAITIHPPIDPRYRAWCGGPAGRITVLPAFPYGERNLNIVLETKKNKRRAVLATPNSFNPVPHSGTWMTIRIALEWQLTVVIVFPDGRVEYRDPTKSLAKLVGLDLETFYADQNLGAA